MNFVSREEVLALLKQHNASDDLQKAVADLFSFPAPNPTMKDGRNVMGQTVDEFWDAVDRQC
jgi:hypothetical protein